MTRGQNGSLLLFCGTLSFPAPCRFIPAHFVSIRGPNGLFHRQSRISAHREQSHLGHEWTRMDTNKKRALPMKRKGGRSIALLRGKNTSASKKPRMEQTESSEPLTKERFSATPKLSRRPPLRWPRLLSHPLCGGCLTSLCGLR